MQNQDFRIPVKPFRTIASIATILNILMTIFIGLVSFYAIGVGDPVSDAIDFEAFYREKQIGLTMVKTLTVFFIIGFATALVLWLKGKQYWSLLLPGLALLHILVLIYCINVVWPRTFFYLFSALDFVIIVVIFLDKRVHSQSFRSG